MAVENIATYDFLLFRIGVFTLASLAGEVECSIGRLRQGRQAFRVIVLELESNYFNHKQVTQNTFNGFYSGG